MADAGTCRPAFAWRADWFQIGRRRSNIICVNEESLFSFVLLDQKQMTFKKTMLNILNRIGDCLYRAGVYEEHIRQGLSEVCLVKHADRRVIGTMNDQKFRYEWDSLNPHPSITSIDVLEFRNNACPLGMFNMKTSQEVFNDTVKKESPTEAKAPSRQTP
jgi:hypothetical protein